MVNLPDNIFDGLWVDTSNPAGRDQPFLDGCVSWYEVIEGLDGGKFFYDILGFNHGQLSSAAWSRAIAPVRTGCLDFANNSNYAEIADASSLKLESAFSIAFWILLRQYGASTDGSILTKFNGLSGGADSRGIRVDGSNFYLSENNSNQLDLATWVTVNVWHHVVYTVSAAKALTGYVDGVSRATGSTVGTFFNNSRVMRIGAPEASFFNSGTPSADFLLNKLGLFSKSLSAAEVYRLFVATKQEVAPYLNYVGWPLPASDAVIASSYNGILGGGVGSGAYIIGA